MQLLQPSQILVVVMIDSGAELAKPMQSLQDVKHEYQLLTFAPSSLCELLVFCEDGRENLIKPIIQNTFF